jgi:hypothetical protein
VIIGDAVKYYEGEACQYKATIFDKFKKEIVTQMLADMYKGFDLQLKMIRASSEDHFEEEMQKITQRGDKLNHAFHQQTMELLAGIIGSFKKKCAALLIEDCGWGEEI